MKIETLAKIAVDAFSKVSSIRHVYFQSGQYAAAELLSKPKPHTIHV